MKYHNKHKYCAALLVICMVLTMALPVSAASFTDVTADCWYADAVSQVADGGVMAGTSNATFSPLQLVTRGMAAVVLWRLAGSPASSGKTSFPDVPDGSYYADAAAWAAQQSIVTGYSSGKFCGGDTVTREQLAVMFYRYCMLNGAELAQGMLSNYVDDNSISIWARAGMSYAVGAGIISGNGANQLNPGGSADRAQLAVMVDRLMTPAMG
ncbi:MAG: S-layer homology domain-containing protein [Intestinimonas sp.]|jgi:hypothetical protein|nr:S-layer homology domain-containing protein [Intestinimonas sp.]